MASDNDDDDDSDDDGDGSEDADQDKQARMMSELARLESDEKKMIHTLSQSAKADVEKGRHVRAQLALWESLLEIRIRIQKIVDLANRLPQPDVYASVLEAAAEFQASPSSAIGAEVLQTASSELVALLNDLVSIRLELVARNPLSKIAGSDAISRKRKHSLVDVIAEDDGEPTDKHARLAAAFDDVIAPLDAGFVAFRDETIDKWNSKVQVASGIPLQKKFKVINQSIVSQIHQILQDRERLVKRTQLSRSDYPIIGKPVAARPSEQELAEQAAEQQASGISDEQRDKHLSNYDVEIFDDSDYYQQLLKELIESRMAETDDPIMLGMKFAQLKQMNKRNKKKVDTKASKGRKVRYHVHEKLQNFMASEPRGYWHEEMISELFASLFGRQSKGSAQADAQDTAGDAPTVQITATDGFKILG
ncbi:apoptosis-antagonizing transcription factor [Entophlyctis helioformis]|nr:apoptosis-antagonizing transcription factor [Entophlyctis helioformis]